MRTFASGARRVEVNGTLVFKLDSRRLLAFCKPHRVQKKSDTWRIFASKVNLAIPCVIK